MGLLPAVAIVVTACMLTLSAGYPFVQKTNNSCDAICLEPDCVIASSAVLRAMDQTADPCVDFYQYACGGWLAEAELLPWQTSTSKSFEYMTSKNLKIIKTILQTTPDGTMSEALQKAKTYYTTCMDIDSTESAGAKPLIKLVESLNGWGPLQSSDSGESNEDESTAFLTTLIDVHKLSCKPLFGMSVTPDNKASSENIVAFIQAGLGLGPREFYLGGHKELLKSYKQFGVTVSTLLADDIGVDTSTDEFKEVLENKIEQIMKFETELATITLPKSQLHDPWKSYHKMSLGEFGDMIPAIDISTYMYEMFGKDVLPDTNVLVPTKEYFRQLNVILQAADPSVLHDYLVWHVVLSTAGLLAKRYQDAVLTFNRVYTGVSVGRPRWMTCVSRTDDIMGFATGEAFIKKEREEIADKKTIEELMNSIKQTFIDNLPSVKWMDPVTASVAADKARAMTYKLVAPSWIRDPDKLNKHYEKLQVTTDSYATNVMNAANFYLTKNLAKLHKPVDKTEWHMAPAQVNAYYSEIVNQMVFPAGILQPPFYYKSVPKMVLYATIGWIMGHELIHGFDDTGRKYDKDGNLNNWWENRSAKAYTERAQCIRTQYNSYNVLGNKHIDGLLTLGENIADNGGIRLSLTAYNNYMKSKETISLPGLQGKTPAQLFFITAAQTWCTLKTSESQELSLLWEPHSPGKYRVIGSMSNLEEFSAAFQCPLGSAMNPTNKCRVW